MGLERGRSPCPTAAATAEMSNLTPNAAGGIPRDEGGNEWRQLGQEVTVTTWGPERNPMAREAALAAGSPRAASEPRAAKGTGETQQKLGDPSAGGGVQ